MYQWWFGDFTGLQLAMLALAGILAGVNKTGVPGVGILMVPLLAMILPARASTGLLLPLLAFADLFAVAYYRKHAHWKHVLKLLPWSLTGIVTGSVIIRYIDDRQLKPMIGFIVLAMLILNWQRQRKLKASGDDRVPHHWSFAVGMGFAAGLTTQMANAAGPVMVIYLLAMQLPKNEFIGTGAWYFLIVNWLKLPLFIWDGRITLTSVRADLALLPLVAVGALMGIFILKKMPQKHFNAVIQILALAATLRLCWSVVDLF